MFALFPAISFLLGLLVGNFCTKMWRKELTSLKNEIFFHEKLCNTELQKIKIRLRKLENEK